MRVLVVDDEPLVRRFLTRALSRKVCRVETVADGQEALDYLQEHDEQPSIVLSDLAMPRVNGIELARRLQQLPRRPPVVLMTAYDPPEVQDLLDAGVLVAFLRKPTPMRTLIAILERHATPC